MLFGGEEFHRNHVPKTSDVEQISMFEFSRTPKSNDSESMHKRQSTSFMRSSKVRQLNML